MRPLSSQFIFRSLTPSRTCEHRRSAGGRDYQPDRDEPPRHRPRFRAVTGVGRLHADALSGRAARWSAARWLDDGLRRRTG